MLTIPTNSGLGEPLSCLPGTAIHPGTKYFPEHGGGIWNFPAYIGKGLNYYQSGPFVGYRQRQPRAVAIPLSQSTMGRQLPSLALQVPDPHPAPGHPGGPGTYPRGQKQGQPLSWGLGRLSMSISSGSPPYLRPRLSHLIPRC